MALVSYGCSNSESESDTEEECNETVKNPLFSSLPPPKKTFIIEEALDDVLLKKKETKERVKITIPALSTYNSDDEKDDKPKKIINSEMKPSGLFAILPKPKHVVDANKFDPVIVKQKNLIPRTIKSTKLTKKSTDVDDEQITNSGFFSTILTDTKMAPAPPTKIINNQIDSAKYVKDVNSKSNAFFSNLAANFAQKSENQDSTEEEGVPQKKKKMEKGETIDVNTRDIMPDPEIMRVKSITEEKEVQDVSSEDEPSSLSRRKHQITFLAYQAKLNEQKLKNEWAMNRMSRKQTQAKYGF